MRSKLSLLFVIPFFVFVSNLSVLHANPVKHEKLGVSAEQPNSTMPIAKVSINTADAEMLALNLVGVGLKKAKAIVEYRQKYGPFSSLSQLAEVPGFGPVLVQQNLARLKL